MVLQTFEVKVIRHGWRHLSCPKVSNSLMYHWKSHDTPLHIFLSNFLVFSPQQYQNASHTNQKYMEGYNFYPWH